MSAIQLAPKGAAPQYFTSPGRDILNLLPVWLEDLLNRDQKASALGCPDDLLKEFGIDADDPQFWIRIEDTVRRLWAMAELSAGKGRVTVAYLLEAARFRDAPKDGRLALMYFIGVRAFFTFLATVHNFQLAQNVQDVMGYFRELCRIDPEAAAVLLGKAEPPPEFMLSRRSQAEQTAEESADSASKAEM